MVVGLEKNGRQAIGKSRGGWTTKIHMVAASDRIAVGFKLSAGQVHDAQEGRTLLCHLRNCLGNAFVLMDRAYEGNQTRELACSLGLKPVVSPKRNRLQAWEYDQQLYKRRNEVERLFRRLKGFRRIATRFEKLDTMFLGFITFALIVDALRK